MLETIFGVTVGAMIAEGLSHTTEGVLEVTKEAVKHATGGAVRDAADALHGGVMARVAGHFALDRNHDAARAIRRAQIHSLQRVLREWRATQERTHWAGEADGQDRLLFFDRADAFFGKQIGLCPDLKLKLNDDVTREIERSLDSALAGAKTPTLEARAAALRAAAERAVLEEVAEGIKKGATDSIVVASSFRRAFVGQEPGVVGWFDGFVLNISKELKSGDGKFRAIFVAIRLSAIAEASLETNAVVQNLTRALETRGEEVQRQLKRVEDKLDQLPDEILKRLVAAVDTRDEARKAADAGIERRTLFELARRLKPAENLSFEQAIIELQAAIDMARKVVAFDKRRANRDDLVSTVLVRIAERTRDGDLAGAAIVVDGGLAEWERTETERRVESTRTGIALLQAALKQDLLRRDISAAARRAERIVMLEQPQDKAAQFLALWKMQDAFYVDGRDKGVNISLEVAVEIARSAIRQSHSASDRGAALNDLGNALRALGERETRTARLEEAVAAYRDALKLRTRKRFPLNWAITKNNLGNALRALGERETDTTRLRQAVAAYGEALTVRTRKRVPLDWAMTQNNLGTALHALGARETGTARLEKAVAAYRNALKVRTRKRVPLQWAMTLTNLGAALRTLAGRETGTRRLKEAAAAYRNALKVRTRLRVPLQWAMTQNNLGNALLALGERGSGTARLRQAVTAYRQALKEYTEKRAPRQWAMTQNNLGNALLTLGERERGTARLHRAVSAYREALKERTRDRVPLDWATSTGNLGVALRWLAERRSDVGMAQMACDHLEDAFNTTRDGGHPPNAEYYKAELTKARELVADLKQTEPGKRRQEEQAPVANRKGGRSRHKNPPKGLKARA